MATRSYQRMDPKTPTELSQQRPPSRKASLQRIFAKQRALDKRLGALEARVVEIMEDSASSDQSDPTQLATPDLQSGFYQDIDAFLGRAPPHQVERCCLVSHCQNRLEDAWNYLERRGAGQGWKFEKEIALRIDGFTVTFVDPSLSSYGIQSIDQTESTPRKRYPPWKKRVEYALGDQLGSWKFIKKQSPLISGYQKDDPRALAGDATTATTTKILGDFLLLDPEPGVEDPEVLFQHHLFYYAVDDIDKERSRAPASLNMRAFVLRKE